MKNLIYSSECMLKNFWQRYEIYQDGLILKSLFGTYEIPFENIEEFHFADSDFKGLLKGNLQLKNFRPAIKLDLANFTEHIVIDKSDGFIHRILFSPDNPKEFFDKLSNALKNFKENNL